MGYNAAAQYQAMLAELQAARKVIATIVPVVDRGDLLSDDWLRVNKALAAYDDTPKAVLDHQPDQQPTRRT